MTGGFPNNEKSIHEGFLKEEQFFKKHPVYFRDRALLAKCGKSRLSKAPMKVSTCRPLPRRREHLVIIYTSSKLLRRVALVS